MEEETIFYYWWLGHVLSDIGKSIDKCLKSFFDEVLVTRLGCNVVIYLTASRHLPEFQGYKPKTFPHQPPPRPIILEPKRLSLPPDFASEWKKIGSKRGNLVDIIENNPSAASKIPPIEI